MVRLTPWRVYINPKIWLEQTSTRGIDIMNDAEFNEANKVFTAQCVELKKDGQDKLHKPPILDDDLIKLYKSGVFN